MIGADRNRAAAIASRRFFCFRVGMEGYSVGTLLGSFLTFSIAMNPKEHRERFDKFKTALEGVFMTIPGQQGINPTDIENWGCKYASVKVTAFLIAF